MQKKVVVKRGKAEGETWKDSAFCKAVGNDEIDKNYDFKKRKDEFASS